MAIGSATHQWLLFGHVFGVAVLAAGVGAYVAGLGRLSAAGTARQLRAAIPVVTWGVQLTIGGVLVVLVTGVLLGLETTSFDEAWLITSLVVFLVLGVAGRLAEVRLKPILDEVNRMTDEPATADLDRVTRVARSRMIHLSADAAVLSIIEILYLMTLRPGWWGIVISLVVMGAALVGQAWRLGRGLTGGAA